MSRERAIAVLKRARQTKPDSAKMRAVQAMARERYNKDEGITVEIRYQEARE